MINQNTADSKILILYLVKNAPGVSYQMLMDKCMESLYTDFFVFSQCYNELIEGNLMDKIEVDTGTGEVLGTNETLHITAGGEAILEDVSDFINPQVMGYLRKAALELKDALLQQNSIKAFAEPSTEFDGKFLVKLSNSKNGRNFECSFICDDKETSDKILSSWRSNADLLTETFINNIKGE